ncbi:penicillin-binding transpeptidase domain-containing protein [Fusibacter bizertensis]|uniref:Beta-lactamase n=1 Tax=Fusibacter bizertensis TaxID=1488331 RepID=A0ABT6NG26_9FIRM|nr:penicillin-binding transpeptidase domain-containing protein [Fusibacter bizertensis]MDH8679386.1 penicillin-binding transpeptidase domain-containing protein [Fusibacter bizertensis]
MKKSTTNSRILHIFILISLIFISLIVYMSYFELYGKESIMANSYNRRLKANEAGIIRGQIFDRNGEVLAFTKVSDGAMSRNYPFKNLYAHVIGYNSDIYGKTLLEAQYNDTLLGINALGLVGNIVSLVTGEDKTGDNLILTIDHNLQAKARELMGDSRGSIVAINPKTGEILAMVSTPDYNPNESSLEKNWDEVSTNESSPLLPRAILGLYPPGSTFKIVTAIAAIEDGLVDFKVEDTGSVIIDGKTFSNSGNKAYGELDMTSAMAFSSNVYFTKLSELLSSKKLIQTAEKSGINKKFSFDLPLNKSSINTEISSKTEFAATVIGQGKLLVTPLQMALICSGIANEGVIMKPYLVKSVSDKNNKVLTETIAKKLYKFTDAKTSELIKDMMIEVVRNGTGQKSAISGVEVAGKTGTAQNEKSNQGEGNDHAWFIGFAPAENPEIAIAVILEYQSKDGGQIAAPIARKVISEWLKNKKK